MAIKATEGDKDVYNWLGEDIWISVLSLLPLQEVVRTSGISRNWQSMWKSIPCIEISNFTIDPMKIFNGSQMEEDEEETDVWSLLESERWVQIADKIIGSHDGPISCLTLSNWWTNCSIKESWINSLTKKCIGELTVEGYRIDAKVPSSLFKCKTLKKLRYEGGSLQCLSLRAHEEGISILRFITLKSTQIQSGAIESLISNCTFLEHLDLDECDHIDATHLKINSRNLKELNINLLHGQDLKFVTLHTPYLENLELGDSVCLDKIIINAPELKRLSLYNYMGKDVPYGDLFKEGRKLSDILHGASHINNLHLCGVTSKLLSAVHISLPTFKSLSMLSIHLDLSERRGVILLYNLLRSCPRLEELHLVSYNIQSPFVEGWKKEKSLGHEFWEKVQPVTCLEETLTTVVMDKLRVDEYEMGFLRFLLSKGRVLKKLNANYFYMPSSSHKFSFHEFVASENVKLCINSKIL